MRRPKTFQKSRTSSLRSEIKNRFRKQRPREDCLPYNELIAPVRFPHIKPTRTPPWLWGALLFILIFLSDFFFSTTELISPISSWFLYLLTGIGFLIGCSIGLSTYKVRREQRSQDRFLLRELNLPASKILTVLITGGLVAASFNHFAWRAANHWEFVFSGQQFQQVNYPILEIKSGYRHSRPHLEIDPYHTGQNAWLTISSEQYLRNKDNFKGLCVSVSQRRSPNGSVQVVKYGRKYWSGFRPPDIVPCK
jgi:hypothetical protein